MTGKKRTEISIQTETIVFVEGTPRYVCWRCRPYVPMLSLDQAVMAAGIGWRHVLNAVENNAVHHVETREGTLLICRDSLLNVSPETTVETNGLIERGN